MGQVPILQTSGLSHAHEGEAPLFKDLSFTLEAGECVWLSGPNGSGKSTLVRLILGLDRPTRGNVDVKVGRHQIAYLPQLSNASVHLPLTLWNVMKISLNPVPDWKTIEALGLLSENHGRLSWNSASGGERSRTMLTISLLQKPSLLVLDEPFNHLDMDSRQKIMSALGNYLRATDQGPRAAVVVSHEDLSRTHLSDVVKKKITFSGTGDAYVS